MATMLSLTELMKSPEWAKLNDRQAAFCAKYLVSLKRIGVGDAVGAAQVAYKTKDSKSATAFSYELLGSKRIRAVLDLASGHTALDGLVADLRRLIKKSERALKLVERHIAGKA
jgi:hypothetical protein